MTSYDIQKYLVGSSKNGLFVPSRVYDQVAEEYVNKRRQAKKTRLNWRKSKGSKRSLGWIPFKVGAVKYRGGQVVFNGINFKCWDSYGLSKYTLKGGSIGEDSRGRWYLNVAVEVQATANAGVGSVGIDLGLKDVAATSDGHRLDGCWHKNMQDRLAASQRANKKAKTASIHAKIANRRKDDMHKFTTAITRRNAAVFIGNVSSSNMIKTPFSKSVHDAGWATLKSMLEYKCRRAGVIFEVLDERYTTQVCSCCGAICDSSPKGRAGLGIREWTCECGAAHDRDINAARNILALGHQRLAGGISGNKAERMSIQQPAAQRQSLFTRDEIRQRDEAKGVV
jgi:IS605 OrfB family transposase